MGPLLTLVVTLMAQVWNPSSSEDEVLVMVCRTGLDTAMGSIIRELLVPAKATQKDPVVAVRHSILLAVLMLIDGSPRPTEAVCITCVV